MFRRIHRGILPGFGLSFGITFACLGFFVLIPIAALFLRTAEMTWAEFVASAFSNRALATYRLTFITSLIAGIINLVFGFVVAWVLVRYTFPGRRLVDAAIDLPFALPTAVAGIALTSLYAENGVLGAPLMAIGIKAAFSPIGITIALTFIGLPFVVRMVQPVLQDLESEVEEASASLGANRWQTFWRVILPVATPALLTGFALSFARALGEYGSVVFIAGNMPMKTEIASLLIITRLEQYDYAGATAIAVVMLVAAFILLLSINLLQAWSRRLGAE